MIDYTFFMFVLGYNILLSSPLLLKRDEPFSFCDGNHCKDSGITDNNIFHPCLIWMTWKKQSLHFHFFCSERTFGKAKFRVCPNTFKLLPPPTLLRVRRYRHIQAKSYTIFIQSKKQKCDNLCLLFTQSWQIAVASFHSGDEACNARYTRCDH